MQEVVKMILERIYEPTFSNRSHGFRPNRSCQTALKQIQNTFTGANWFVEGDIHACFDSFDHHVIIDLLRKRIEDEAFIQLIWKFLKAGYMEQWEYNRTYSGVPQGSGVSPILANIYLNELDWELEKEQLRFVRYADDSIVMCRTPQELAKAKEVVRRVLSELGLELADEKTREIDFHNDDFDYLGFRFHHIYTGRDGNWHYFVAPTPEAISKYRSELKGKTRKSLSHSFEEWAQILNPIIRGKLNYFLAANRACRDVWMECRRRDMPFHGRAKRDYKDLDAYLRQRLRVNFANRGKRHAKYVDGKLLNVKYGNEFFFKVLKLVHAQYMTEQLRNPKLTPDEFLYMIKRKGKRTVNDKTRQFYAYAYER